MRSTHTTFRSSAASLVLALVAIGAGPALAGTDGDTDPFARPAPVAAAPRPDLSKPGPAEPERLDPRPPTDGRDAPDPFVFRAGDLWVLFSTQVGLHNVPVTISTDLVHWYPPADAMPVLPSWAAWGRTWAPGAFEIGGGYALYFAAHHAATGRQCIGVATAKEAYGPYTPVGDAPLVCQLDQGGSIDPFPFVDEQGVPHLLWKADGNAVGIASRLYSQRLTADGLGLEGEPVELLRSGSAWEQPLIENPAMAVVDGRYVLLYSGGWWESEGYATGYATCAGPAGPCDKVTVDAPAHRGADGEAGSGGAASFRGPAGDDWVVYHAWDADRVGYRDGGVRSVRFAPVAWGATGLAIG
jgi:hypothetical protein